MVVVGIANLFDVTKELVHKIACFVEVIDLGLLSINSLLRSIELQKDSARNCGQDRDHDQHFDEREPALLALFLTRTFSHDYVPCPTTVLIVTTGPKTLPLV